MNFNHQNEKLTLDNKISISTKRVHAFEKTNVDMYINNFDKYLSQRNLNNVLKY